MIKKRLSFFAILLIGNILLVGIIILISGLFSWHHLDNEYQKSSETEQARLLEVAQEFFEHTWPDTRPDIGTINRSCRRLITDRELRITVIYKDGLVLGDSWANPEKMENHRTEDRPEIMTVLKTGKPGRSVRTSETVNVELRCFALPIRKDGQIEGVIRIAMPVRAIAEGSGLIRSALLWSASLAIVSAILLASILSWIWYSPLRQLTPAAREIASRERDSQPPSSGACELAQLSMASA